MKATRDLEQTDGLIREAKQFARIFLIFGLGLLFAGLVALDQGVIIMGNSCAGGSVVFLLISLGLQIYVFVKARRTQVVDGHAISDACGEMTSVFYRIPNPSTKRVGDHYEHAFDLTEEANES